MLEAGNEKHKHLPSGACLISNIDDMPRTRATTRRCHEMIDHSSAWAFPELHRPDKNHAIYPWNTQMTICNHVPDHGAVPIKGVFGTVATIWLCCHGYKGLSRRSFEVICPLKVHITYISLLSFRQAEGNFISISYLRPTPKIMPLHPLSRT